MEIQVKNIDHLGIIAGIVDQIGLVEEIDRHIEKHPQQLISTGQVVNPLDDFLNERTESNYTSSWLTDLAAIFVGSGESWSQKRVF